MDEVVTSSSPDAARLNPFAPQHCPDCGYALNGLPAEGRCPECGKPYDASTIVIYGYGAGARSHGWNSAALRHPGMRAAWFVVTLGLLLFLWWNSRSPRMMTVYLAAIAASAAFTWWRGRNITSPLPVQLRLTPQGFAQRDGFGEVQLIPWNTRWLWIRIRRTRRDRGQMEAGRGWPWILILRNWVGIDFEAEFSSVQGVRRQVETWMTQAGVKPKLAFREKVLWWHLMA